MPKSELVKAYEAGAKEAHKQAFTLSPNGEKSFDVELPRLHIGNRAKFELQVRKHNRKFSLAGMRQKALFAMAKCQGDAVEEIRREGLPDKFKDETEAKLWDQLLITRIMVKFGDYSDSLFSDVTEELQAEAVALAIQQEEDSTEAKVGKKTVPIDQDFVAAMLAGEEEKPTLANMFLWVIGIARKREEGEEELPATASDLIAKRAGDPKNLEGRGTQQAAKK